MFEHALLVAHIAVLGYWLGSELVINSTYRYVSWHAIVPFEERSRLMQHVLDVDQHVRYALILQATLGTMLAALYGYIPGGGTLALAAGVIGTAWFILVEITHRMRHASVGATLAAVDRAIRYTVLALLIAAGGAALLNAFHLPLWLALKLILFAGVILCGVGIRLELIGLFKVWAEVEREGSTEEREHLIRHIYVRATSILGGLWLCIAGIVALSVWKP